jgi:hypothetical protein
MYGPKDVTALVREKYRGSTSKPKRVAVSNANLGGDPQPGVAKALKVLYRWFAPNHPVEAWTYVTLKAREGSDGVFQLKDQRVELVLGKVN